MFSSGGSNGAAVVASDDGKKVVAQVTLSGIISDSGGEVGAKQELSFRSCRPLLEQAFAVPDLMAVVLLINCPGGSPTQTALIADFIRQKADDQGTKVFALVEDVAASGGYWLACSADIICVDPNSMVGSIGVIAQSVGVREALANFGVEPRVITSVKNKAGMNPLVDMNQDAVDLVKGHLTAIHANFIGWVKSRRPMIKKETEKDVFSGRVYVGQEAVDIGLADRVQNLTEALKTSFPKDWEELKVVEVKRKCDGSLLGLLGKLLSSGTRLLRVTNSLMRDRNWPALQSGIQALLSTGSQMSESGD